MKKRTRSLALLVASSLAFSGILVGCTPIQRASYQGLVPLPERKTEVVVTAGTATEPMFLTKQYQDDGSPSDLPFNILAVTDLHLMGQNNEDADRITLTALERAIALQQPDLVVITGDIALDGYAYQGVDALGALFEKTNTYWAIVFGNHDGEHHESPSKEALLARYQSYPHCLVQAGDPSLFGLGNYVIHLKNSHGAVYESLFFLDSGSVMDEETAKAHGLPYKKGGYDFIKQNQMDWYVREVQAQTARNGGAISPSMLFLHIPLPEYPTAYKKGYLFGARLEKECPAPVNSGMFETLVAQKSTKTVVCGHDHVNNYAGELSGITLLYAGSSSFGSYHSRKGYQGKLSRAKSPFLDGHTLFQLSQTNGDVAIYPFYNQEIDGIFEGLSASFDALGISKTLPK